MVVPAAAAAWARRSSPTSDRRVPTRVFELADAVAERATNLRQAFRSKQQQREEQKQDDFAWADVTHPGQGTALAGPLTDWLSAEVQLQLTS